MAVGISAIQSQAPCPSHPVERAVKIVDVDKEAVLVAAEDIPEITVSPLPINAIKVLRTVDTEEIVEVDFIDGFHLLQGKIEFVCHLVSEEQSFLTCLVIPHGFCAKRQGHACHQGDDVIFHFAVFLMLRFYEDVLFRLRERHGASHVSQCKCQHLLFIVKSLKMIVIRIRKIT